MTQDYETTTVRMLNIPLILILTLGSAVIICQAEDGGTIKCDASASEIGETGEVQCMYPTDLTGIAVVSILHFEPNSTNDVPIVDCRRDEIRHCTNVKPGFKVTEVTGKSLNVTISKVTKSHFGKYVCEIFHESLDFSAEPCIFQIKGATSPGLQSNSPVVDEDPEPGEVIGDTFPGLQSNYPVVDEDPEPGEVIDSEEGLSGGAVAGYVICAVIIVVLTAVVVLCYFRRRKNNLELVKPRYLEHLALGYEKRDCQASAAQYPRPSRENDPEAGTSKGSNEGGAEKPMLLENSEDGQDRRRKNSLELEKLEGVEDLASGYEERDRQASAAQYPRRPTDSLERMKLQSVDGLVSSHYERGRQAPAAPYPSETRGDFWHGQGFSPHSFN